MLSKNLNFKFIIRDYSIFIATAILSYFVKLRRPNNTKVTIIKYDGLGDFVLFMDIAKEFRRMYPDKKIILSCSPEAKIIANETTYFDEVICFTKNEFRFWNLIGIYKKSKLLDCEILLHPTVSRDYNAEILMALTRASKKYSVHNEYSFPERIHKWFEKQYNEIFDVGRFNMALKQNAIFVKKLGNVTFQSSLPRLEINTINHLYLPQDYFVVFVGASKWDKIWLKERFLEIIAWLNRLTKLNCIVCGKNEDLYMVNFFDAHGIDFINFVGKTNLNELIYIISKSKFIFGNDTSAIHIAAALNVPSVCIRSAVSMRRFYPYSVDSFVDEKILPVAIGVNPICEGCALLGEFLSCKEYCKIPGKMNCISDVSVNMVKEELYKFLKTRDII